MKKQLIKTLTFFIFILLLISLAALYLVKDYLKADESENSIVLLNEIKVLTTDDNGENIAGEQLETLLDKESKNRENKREAAEIIIVCFAIFDVVYLLVVFLYVYIKIIKPFNKLSVYAGELAKGNFDVELSYERKNFFGAFTWAFDHMREEIKRARKCEADAVGENKLIIATLSHDIKTPIASIRAYAEGLEASLDNSYEKRCKYAATIIRKCDEVTKLTNDLVLHSLSELDKLEFNMEECNLKDTIENTIRDLGYNTVKIEGLAEGFAKIDLKRFEQVIENILNNAKKYAKDCSVIVLSRVVENNYEVHIKDSGSGIPDEDLPFIFDKFYRGRNAENIDGSGLGLYIVKYIMDQMGGEVSLKSSKSGLEVVLLLKLL